MRSAAIMHNSRNSNGSPHSQLSFQPLRGSLQRCMRLHVSSLRPQLTFRRACQSPSKHNGRRMPMALQQPDQAAPPAEQPPGAAAAARRKKHKEPKQPPPVEQRPPGKCQFYMARKGRYCNFDATPGKNFCGNHLYEVEGTGPKRVPCPWDPGHTVVEAELNRHRDKCPGYQLMVQERSQPYFSEDINAGPAEDAVQWPEGLAPAGADAAVAPAARDGARQQQRQDGQGRRQQGDQQQQAALQQAVQQEDRERKGRGPKGRTAMQAAFAASLGERRFEDLICRIEAACQQACEPEPLSLAIPPAAEPLLQPESATENRPFELKHAQQQASIVGNMQERGLLRDAPSVTYVEYGAGKGYLSQMLSACTDASKIVMVDVRGFKTKADRGMRHLELQRLRCDIKDLDVAQVSGLGGGAAPWVALGKHLCGAATDFTLRSCARELQRQRDQPQQAQQGQQAAEDEPQQGGVAQQGSAAAAAAAAGATSAGGGGLRGLAVATCCHHRCSWQHFVAKREVQELGFSPLDFEAIVWMTGWALAGHELPAGCGGGDGGEERAEQGEASQQAQQGQQAQQAQQQEGHAGHKRGREGECQPASLREAQPAPGDGAVAEQTDSGEAAAAAAAPGGAWRPQLAIARERKLRVGMLCKRLIDACRTRWLRRQGFVEADLVQYVEPTVSGENRLLLAVAAAARCGSGGAMQQ